MRHFIVPAAAFLIASGLAQAGQITNIGGTSGLTSGVVTATNVSNVSYQNFLFQKATGTPAITAPTASTSTPLTVYDTGNNPNSDGNVSFALMQGNAGGTANEWYNMNTDGTSNIYVPVGVKDVETAWTMLNDLFGSSVQVTFAFNTTNSLTGATNVSLNLSDGSTIRDSVLCGTPGTSAGCPSGAAVGLAGTTAVSATNLPNSQTTINVTTGSINYPNSAGANNTKWNPAYSTVGSTQPDFGSTGTLTLDDQAYQFGSLFAADYLVGITITELNSVATSAQGHFALSAVSVESPVPEPATMGLAFSGLILAVGAGIKKAKKA